MNRRSILSSLSSMFVAALAWPRQAEAGNSAKGVKTTYQTRVFNGYYDTTTKQLVAGGAALEVYYHQVGKSRDIAILAPGQVATFKSVPVVEGPTVFLTVYNSGIVGSPGSSARFEQDTLILYILTNASPPIGIPTITKAPAGVKF